MQPVSRTTIVSVCYNSMSVVPTMLASVPNGVNVILVDNASSDVNSLASLAHQAGVRLVRHDENLGFGVGCNSGAAAAESEFLLFLNPDTSLEKDTIRALEAAMDRYPRASAMNPRILNRRNRPYFKRRSVLLPRRDWMVRGWPEDDREVSVLSGAAFFVRKRAFDSVGGFDPAIFLYHEDDDLSLRLRAQCGPLMFIRDAVVRHIGGSSAPRSPATASLKAWHMGRSRVYAARKHRLKYPFALALVEAVIQLANPTKLVSARTRAKSWAFLQGVLSSRIR